MENIFQRPPILMRLTMLTRDKISLLRAASLRTARETAHGLNDRKKRGLVEAGILPLNYSRLPYFSSTYQFSKDLGRTTASLFRLLRPSKTMGFDRKMDSKVDSKPVWGTRFRRSRLLSTLLSIPRQIHHITLDVRTGRTRARVLGASRRP